ncbi:MAG: acetylesterase [Ruminococcus sp.]|nr:acetylesterase [Ruminococcus sp.]
MASFCGTVYSKALGMDTNLNIITPRGKSSAATGAAPRVAYLLHGLSDNAAAWIENTCLREYADKYNMAFVMPEVQRGFYIDAAYGLDYFTYIADELPEIVGKIFNFSHKREDTYIFGLSMGGYGALKIGMKRPSHFAGIGGFSSVCSLKDGLANDDVLIPRKEIAGVLGESNELLEKEELLTIAREFSACREKPEIYISCGKGDFLLDMNREFEYKLGEMKIPHIYEEWTGIHNWKFWRESLEKALAVFLGE